MIICPNLKNKAVAAEFNKLKSIVGKSLAYKVWSDNNGNNITKDRNGNNSSIYNRLVPIVGETDAIKIKSNTFTDGFYNKYGKWIDNENEPKLDSDFIFKGNVDIPLTHSKIKHSFETSNFFKFKTNSETTTEKYNNNVANKLGKLFNKYGINVNIITDTTIDSHKVETKNGIPTITINPNKLYKDSIFHEFGHIYIDLIADQEYVSFAIEQLRNTTLWDEIENVYSDYNDSELGKEVLTTAIGLKAAELEALKSKSNLLFIINRIIDRFASTFRIKNDIAKDLAYDLVNGTTLKDINNLNVINTNFQRLSKLSSELTPFKEYLNIRSSSLSTIYSEFKGRIEFATYEDVIKSMASKMKSAVMVKDEMSVFEISAAMIESLQYDVKLVKEVAAYIKDLEFKYLNKGIVFGDIPTSEFNEIATKLDLSRNFIKTFTDVNLLNEIDFNAILDNPQLFNLKAHEAEELIKIRNKINDILYTDNNLVKQIDLLDNSLTVLTETVFAPYILSLTTDPQYTNAEHEMFVELYNDGLDDEQAQNLFLDSVFDSNNKFVSNATKYIRLYYGKRDLAILDYKARFEKIARAVTDAQIQSVIQDGAIISKYNMREFIDYINAEQVRVNKASKAKKSKLDIYLNPIDGVVPTKLLIPEGEDLFNYIIKRNEEEKAKLDEGKITIEEYNRWYYDNLYLDNNILKPRINSEFLVPNDTFLNARYAELFDENNVKDENLRVFVVELKKMLQELTGHIQNTPQYKGALPAISFKQLPSSNNTDVVDEIITNLDNDIIHHIPFPFLGYLQIDKTIRIPTKLHDESDEKYNARALNTINSGREVKFKTLKEVKEENDKIREANKQSHNSYLNTDVRYTMPLFIESALNHKYKSMIKSMVKMSQVTLRQANINKLNYMGKPQYEKNKTDSKGIKQKRMIEGYQSNASKHFDKYIEMDYYELFTKPNRANKVLHHLKNYTSLTGIGFNIFSATKNITYGSYMMIIEGAANQYVSKAELAKASTEYINAIPAYLANTFSRNKTVFHTSKQAGIIELFNVIENISDLLEKQSPEKQSNKLYKYGNNLAYFMTQSGEHFMHNTMLLGMLNSHRLINGKLYTFNEYYETKKEKLPKLTKDNKAQVNEIIKSNNALKTTLEKEFETYKKASELFELSEGLITFVKDDTGTNLLSDEEFIFFKEKIKGVNQKLHGIYNKADKSILENSAWWQQVFQFRHWMRAGYVKRFGALGTPLTYSSFWNERRNEEDFGSYKQTFRFITQPMVDIFNENRDPANDIYRNIPLMLQAFFQGLQRFAINFKIYYHTMTVHERANVLRTFTEMIVFGFILAAATVLSQVADDDDEDKFWFNFLVYQLDASITELLTFTPVPGWTNEAIKVTTNPTGTWRTMEMMIKTVTSAFGFPFQSPSARVFKTGANKGDYKVFGYAEKLIPGWNVWSRIEALPYNNNAYKLWGMPVDVEDIAKGGKSKSSKSKSTRHL